MTALHVQHPGPRATIQDTGRHGFQHHGLSPGGAADIRSYHWANRLLDNDHHAACIEITLGGFIATVTAPLLMALAGADSRATIDGVPLKNHRAFILEPGSELRLATPADGVFTYLAVAGGWQSRLFCNSRSSVAREKLAGLMPLATSDQIPAAPQPHRQDWSTYLNRQVPGHLLVHLHDQSPLKVMPGPEFSAFTALDRARFINGRYGIGSHSDRMGYRLEGPALRSDGGITSRAVCCGTVQIPGNGEPVVLLNDRQTIGGYPVIGVVPLLDCARLAQKRPGDGVTLIWADVADCQAERLLFERLHKTCAWNRDGVLTRSD